MNIDYANTIPLRTVFDKLCLHPIEQTETGLVYLSPFCPIGKGTITVQIASNQWIDSIDKTRGNVVTLVCRYLKSQGRLSRVEDALKWLKETVGYVVLNCPEHIPDFSKSDRKYQYEDHGTITSSELIRYLEQERGIPLDYARFLIKEVQLRNRETGKRFAALGFINDEGGLFIRSPHIKANLRTQYITFIRGQTIKPQGVHIFRDVIDYLSIITRRHGKPFDDDVIILNQLSNMRISSAFIKSYGYRILYTWLDNNETYWAATRNYAAYCKTEQGLKHKAMNRHYLGFKDVNDWHVAEVQQSPRVFLQAVSSVRLNEAGTRD